MQEKKEIKETARGDKAADHAKRMENAVVGGYKKVEDAVVGGYKKVETAVVGSYQRIEDAFVEKYLTRDGETPEQAKARLKDQTK